MKRVRNKPDIPWISAVALVFLCAPTLSHAAALLDLGAPIPENAFVVVPIEFTPDSSAQTAGLQLDLEIDTTRFEVDSVVAGASATEGGKGVRWSRLDPDHIRVLVAGINQDSLPEGPVASVYLAPLTTSYEDNPCRIEAGVCSDPFGTDVPLILPQPTPNAATEEEPAKTETREPRAQSAEPAGQDTPLVDDSPAQRQPPADPAPRETDGKSDSGTADGALGFAGQALTPDETDRGERAAQASQRLNWRRESPARPQPPSRAALPTGSSTRASRERAASYSGFAPSKRTGTPVAPAAQEQNPVKSSTPASPTSPAEPLFVAQGNRDASSSWRSGPPSFPAQEEQTTRKATRGRAESDTPFGRFAAAAGLGAVVVGLFAGRRRWLTPRGPRRSKGM